jgi:hypothetical protein
VLHFSMNETPEARRKSGPPPALLSRRNGTLSVCSVTQVEEHRVRIEP